jgi:hypothetical protein
MQGYHETRGHSAASVHHTESILPATTPNVKEKYRKNRKRGYNAEFSLFHKQQAPGRRNDPARTEAERTFQFKKRNRNS